MTLGQVRVDPDKLEAAADSISRNREAMERVIREILQITFELQMSWEGIARQRFFDEFFSKKKSMDDLVKHLKHTELELKKSAKTFREVDEKAYGDFNQMGKLWDAFQRGGGRAAGDTIFDPLKKAWNQTSDFFEHLVDDPKDTFEEAKYGLTDFVEGYVDDKKAEFWDTYEFIGDLWNDPMGTLKSEWDDEVQEMYAIRNVLSDWYVKNIEYGDAESITESIAYGATNLAFFGLVTRGVGAVGNGARWGRSLPSVSEFQLGSRLEPAYAYGRTNYKIDTLKSIDTYKLAEKSNFNGTGLSSIKNENVFEKKSAQSFDDLNLKNDAKFDTEGLAKNVIFEPGYDTHLIEVQGVVRKKNKGIVGGHNLKNFEQVFIDNGWDIEQCTISKIEHPSIKGIYEIKYGLPALDREKNIIPGELKNVRTPKTVYDPNIISDKQILEWGKEAMDNGKINGREITGYASNGLKFQGFIDESTGEITNFFPSLK